MTIRHLKIFIEVAESGKMSIAASKFFISQPTVSQTVKELEEHYQVLLFERLSKKLYITDAGRKLLTFARQAVAQFNTLEEAMMSDVHREEVRVGATVTVGSCILADIVRSYKQRHPAAEVYSLVENTRAVEEGLLTSRLDLGIVEGRIKSQELICIPAVQDELIMVCASGHPLAGKSRLNKEDLAGRCFVMREKGSGTREMFKDYLLEKGIGINTVCEANCPDAIRQMVLYGECLTVISGRLVEKELEEGRMCRIGEEEFSWKRNFCVVYHKDKFMTGVLTDLIDEVLGYQKSQ